MEARARPGTAENAACVSLSPRQQRRRRQQQGQRHQQRGQSGTPAARRCSCRRPRGRSSPKREERARPERGRSVRSAHLCLSVVFTARLTAQECKTKVAHLHSSAGGGCARPPPLPAAPPLGWGSLEIATSRRSPPCSTSNTTPCRMRPAAGGTRVKGEGVGVASVVRLGRVGASLSFSVQGCGGERGKRGNTRGGGWLRVVWRVLCVLGGWVGWCARQAADAAAGVGT